MNDINWITIAAMIGPSLLVLGMYGANSIFGGWKTTSLGTVTLLLGSVQTVDWSFLPDNITGPLLAGTGIATLLASHLTERAAQ